MTRSIHVPALAVLTGILAFSACGDAGGDADRDLDGDGLSDARELELGTDPSQADTDGDGRSDAEEVADNRREGSSRLIFHPLIADLPVAAVEVVSRPKISFHETLGVSEEFARTLERTDETSTEQRRVTGGSVSHAVESSFSWSVSGSVSSKVSIVDPSIEVETSFGVEQTDATSSQTTANWSRDQAHARSMALSQIESNTRGRTTTTQGGRVLVSARLANQGHLAWTLKDLRLVAYVLDPRSGGVAFPLPTLSASGGAFPEASIAPGGSIQHPITFQAELNLDEMKALLAHQGGLVIAASHLELLNEARVPFAHDMTYVAQRTAHVVIDYGPRSGKGRGGAGVSEHRVAIPGQFPRGVDAKYLLEQVLGLPVVEGPVEFVTPGSAGTATRGDGLLHVDGYGDEGKRNGYWVVVHRRLLDGGQSEELVRYNPLSNPFRLADVRVQRRESLHLVYVVDSDGDGLGDRDELRWGTDAENPDTDGDGLLDGLEVQGWALADGTRVTANPLLKDADFDGIGDLDEFEAQTDPVRLHFGGTPPSIVIGPIRFAKDGEGRTTLTFRVVVDDPDSSAEPLRGTATVTGNYWTGFQAEIGKEQEVTLRSRGGQIPSTGSHGHLVVSVTSPESQESFVKALRVMNEPTVAAEFQTWHRGPVGDLSVDEQMEAIQGFAVVFANSRPDLYYELRRWEHFASRAEVDFVWP